MVHRDQGGLGAQGLVEDPEPTLAGREADGDHVAPLQRRSGAARSSNHLRYASRDLMSPEDGAAQPPDWHDQGDFTDIRYETAGGIAKLTINRPEVRNAFRPTTLFELRSRLRGGAR